jgi:hypothetical protein
LAGELVPSAVSNIGDYVRINEDCDPVIDLSKATRQQLSAIPAPRKGSRGNGNCAAVRLGKRRGAPDDEVRRIADRLNQMTDEQRLADAKQLAAQIRARLDQDRLRMIEGKATEIED